jgi:hypothetical protein
MSGRTGSIQACGSSRSYSGKFARKSDWSRSVYAYRNHVAFWHRKSARKSGQFLARFYEENGKKIALSSLLENATRHAIRLPIPLVNNRDSKALASSLRLG